LRGQASSSSPQLFQRAARRLQAMDLGSAMSVLPRSVACLLITSRLPHRPSHAAGPAWLLEVEKKYLDGAITNGEHYNKVISIWSS
jgi:hypothetical protein